LEEVLASCEVGERDEEAETVRPGVAVSIVSVSDRNPAASTASS
jgi:hypothetical protein